MTFIKFWELFVCRTEFNVDVRHENIFSVDKWSEVTGKKKNQWEGDNQRDKEWEIKWEWLFRGTVSMLRLWVRGLYLLMRCIKESLEKAMSLWGQMKKIRKGFCFKRIRAWAVTHIQPPLFLWSSATGCQRPSDVVRPLCKKSPGPMSYSDCPRN